MPARCYKSPVSHTITIIIGLILGACASGGSNSALISQPPRDVLSLARSQMLTLGYTINEQRSTRPVIDSLVYGELRAERAAGLDLDTRGRLFEVIKVLVRHDVPTGRTRVEVHGGMESLTSAGIWVRVPSTRQVRDEAEALMRKLTGT